MHIPLITILITILSALIIPFFKEKKVAMGLTICSFSLVFLLSIFLGFYLYSSNTGYFTYQLGGISAPFTNELRSGVFESITSGWVSKYSLIH